MGTRETGYRRTHELEVKMGDGKHDGALYRAVLFVPTVSATDFTHSRDCIPYENTTST